MLRDAKGEFEVLLIRRNPELAFHGGVWVFPGGRIEAEDRESTAGDLIEAARRAAVRETWEEVGVRLNPEDLVLMSKWITPEDQPKRYETWFFVTWVDEPKIEIDGEETLDFRWITPAGALDAQKAGEFTLVPPTFVSLSKLCRYSSPADVLYDLAKSSPEVFIPKVRLVAGGFCSLYQDDVAYEGGEIDKPGRYHRLWGLSDGWRYERTAD